MSEESNKPDIQQEVRTVLEIEGIKQALQAEKQAAEESRLALAALKAEHARLVEAKTNELAAVKDKEIADLKATVQSLLDKPVAVPEGTVTKEQLDAEIATRLAAYQKEAEAKLQAANNETYKERRSHELGILPEFMSLVTGDTKESIEASLVNIQAAQSKLEATVLEQHKNELTKAVPRGGLFTGKQVLTTGTIDWNNPAERTALAHLPDAEFNKILEQFSSTVK